MNSKKAINKQMERVYEYLLKYVYPDIKTFVTNSNVTFLPASSNIFNTYTKTIDKPISQLIKNNKTKHNQIFIKYVNNKNWDKRNLTLSNIIVDRNTKHNLMLQQNTNSFRFNNFHHVMHTVPKRCSNESYLLNLKHIISRLEIKSEFENKDNEEMMNKIRSLFYKEKSIDMYLESNKSSLFSFGNQYSHFLYYNNFKDLLNGFIKPYMFKIFNLQNKIDDRELSSIDLYYKLKEFDLIDSDIKDHFIQNDIFMDTGYREEMLNYPYIDLVDNNVIQNFNFRKSNFIKESMKNHSKVNYIKSNVRQLQFHKSEGVYNDKFIIKFDDKYNNIKNIITYTNPFVEYFDVLYESRNFIGWCENKEQLHLRINNIGPFKINLDDYIFSLNDKIKDSIIITTIETEQQLKDLIKDYDNLIDEFLTKDNNGETIHFSTITAVLKNPPKSLNEYIQYRKNVERNLKYYDVSDFIKYKYSLRLSKLKKPIIKFKSNMVRNYIISYNYKKCNLIMDEHIFNSNIDISSTY